MPPHSRSLALLGLVLASIPWASAQAASDDGHRVSHGVAFEWRTLRVGAGGFLTGIDISSDGLTKVVRTDTYGAYVWSDERQSWKQLVTADSMPAADRYPRTDAGVYEIRVAPGLNRCFYMAFGGYVYRSDDGGGHWARTRFAKVTMDANGAFRTSGQKMAVDPASPDIVYVGTPRSGMFVTADGGHTWAWVDEVPSSAVAPNGAYPGITGIVFDPRTSRNGVGTGTVYASSYSHGVFRTVDGGASWAVLAGGPSDVEYATVGPNGAYYAVGNSNQNLWRYYDGAWTELIAGNGGQGIQAVLVNPSNPNEIVAVAASGYLNVSYNGGTTWSGIDWSISVTSSDIPWEAAAQMEAPGVMYLTVGGAAFSTTNPNELILSTGTGSFDVTVPTTAAGMTGTLAYTDMSAGIENLVANEILVAPGGVPILASWDRPFIQITNLDDYPTTYGPVDSNKIVAGWSVDYASSTPSFLVGLADWWGVEESGYSTNGGRTWTAFPSYPPLTGTAKIGGSIAASTPSNLVWAPSNNGVPYFTLDGGQTWSAAIVPGALENGETGWGFAYYLNRHIVAADRSAPNTFYLYNTLRGLYRSTDGGVTWTLAHAGEIVPWSGSNAELRAVPGRPGQLFFTAGPQGGPDDAHPAPSPLMRSTDGGVTWAPVTAAGEVHAFGFGKGRGDYPAIFIAGWIKGDYGIWRSDDAAKSWVKNGKFPLGILSQVTAIEGDVNDAERVYVGFRGAGYAFGEGRTGASTNGN